jgi:plasmid maintenance system antidote protein VapI
LGKWIDAHKPVWTRKKVAERLGISLNHVHRLCRRKYNVHTELALKIEELTEGAIPPSYWVTP